MNLDKLLSKLDQVKPLKNGEYQARCPAHDDKTASLSLTEKNGKLLLKCHAGCSVESILYSLGLEKKQLFEEKEKDRIEAVYKYIDMNGKPYEAVRFYPKSFRYRQPEGDGYIWNLTGIKTSLYRINEIDKDKPVFICEGEKDCDNLWNKGLQAVTNPKGAGNWESYYSDLLTGCMVVILPDNDNPGRNHAQIVSESLKEKAKSIKILELPGLPEKGDVTDFLHNNKIEELLNLVEDCEEWNQNQEKYIWLPDLVLEEIGKPEKRLLFKTGFPTLDDLIEFKEERFIVISGLPGYGKTSFCYNLLLEAAKENICLFENLEMDKQETFTRLTAILKNIPIWKVKENNSSNLSAWKANWNPLFTLKNICMDFDENYTMELIDRLCQKIRPKVLFIDNNKLLDTEVETQSDIRHYEMIAKMCKQLSKKRKLCVVLIAHTRKDTLEKEPGLSDIYGASAFAQLADAVLFLHPTDKNDKQWLKLKIAKNRYGRTKDIALRYEEEKTRFTEVI